MSISSTLANKIMLTRILKSAKVLVSDVPASRGFHPKMELRDCPRCEGTATEPDSSKNCSQCGGRGTIKCKPGKVFPK